MRRSGGSTHAAYRKLLAARLLASFVVAVFVASGFTGVIGLTRAASAPNVLAYQGRVLNANGVPVSDATASMKFEIYTAVSGGTCLWSNSSATCDSDTPASTVARTVTLTDGLFSENLGDTGAATPYAQIADSVFGSNATTYLQVYINGEALTPRKQIVAAPYAMNSDTLDGLDATITGATSSAIAAFDASGNLVVTGNPSGSSVSNGSLYVNPDASGVAANDVLIGVASGGVEKFLVDAEGDGKFAGSLNVGSGAITSASAITLSSSGGIVSVAAGSDFSVGSGTLVSAFSVDEDQNIVRIGDGANDVNSPKIVMYASNGSDSGIFGYTDNDSFELTGGNFSHTGLGILPATLGARVIDHSISTSYTGTSLANLNTVEMFGLAGSTSYSAIENTTSTDHVTAGTAGILTISGGTTTLTKGYGLLGSVTNSSTNASLIQGSGYVSGVEGSFIQAAAATLSDGFGVHGSVSATAGTITKAIGVFGEVGTSAGTLTSGYGGYFSNTSAGTNRYGLWAQASGGAGVNISGYFTGGRLHVDSDTTVNVPSSATASGDAYISGAVEIDGSLSIGDTSGVDQVTITSASITNTVAQITANSLGVGTALDIARADDGTASTFDGKLLAISQNDVSSGNGSAISITQKGAGNSVGLYIVQDTVSAHVANSTGNNALVIDVNEAANADNVIVVRSDADNSSGVRDTEFRVNNQGEVFGDGASYTSGADYAEFFLTSDQSLSGMMLACQDRNASDTVKTCNAGNSDVVGVVSTNPGFVGNNIPGASGDLRSDTRYRMIGMVGQIETRVTADEGAIAIGDPISTSMSLSGYGAKARGPVRIIGFALEPLQSGTGTIRVLVHPQWYGGDVLRADGTAVATSSALQLSAALSASSNVPLLDSAALVLRGAVWTGTESRNREMSLRTSVGSQEDYRLSVRNADGVEVAYVNQRGDFSVSGKLYLSDRGTAQQEKYIYYDGSSGSGGDFMRTNASGWSAGSYDFAEMFASPDALVAGDVVVFGDAKEEVKRSTGTRYDHLTAGVVSTQPGFLAGEGGEGRYPIALAGRVPTKVTAENGSIAIGDPLTTSSRPGYAMKATDAGPILGYATEAFSGTEGRIVAFINVSYYDGGPAEAAPAAQNVVSGFAAEIEKFDLSGVLSLNGGSILAIGSLEGVGRAWRIEENGDFVTRGRIVQLVQSYANENIETYVAASRQMTVQLSGTATLQGGAALVDFEHEDPSFNDIIASGTPYRVFLTPYGATGTLYTTNRSGAGFMITEAGSASTGIEVDWLVIAYRKDYEPSVVSDDVSPELADTLEAGPAISDDASTVDEGDVVGLVAPETQVSEQIEVDPVEVVDDQPEPVDSTTNSETEPIEDSQTSSATIVESIAPVLMDEPAP